MKTKQLDATTLEITWDQPEHLNGIIREYEIGYSYNERNSVIHVENKKNVNAISSPTRRFNLKQLMMNTKYNISVRERTGNGLWSERVTVSVTTREGGNTKGYLKGVFYDKFECAYLYVLRHFFLQCIRSSIAPLQELH